MFIVSDNEILLADHVSSSHFKEDENKGINVPFVALERILDAASNFSEANKLGQGGFGPVYKVITSQKPAGVFS